MGDPEDGSGGSKEHSVSGQGAQALAQWLTSAENTQGEPSALFSP